MHWYREYRILGFEPVLLLRFPIAPHAHVHYQAAEKVYRGRNRPVSGPNSESERHPRIGCRRPVEEFFITLLEPRDLHQTLVGRLQRPGVHEHLPYSDATSRERPDMARPGVVVVWGALRRYGGP